MELLYIWIKKYKNIKEQGFNFNPKYRFKFENNELTFTENKEAISVDDFFKIETAKNEKKEDNEPKGKITNVTAIIGQNGAGKSSVLEFIREYLAADKISNTITLDNRESIVIFDNYILYHSSIIIDNDIEGFEKYPFTDFHYENSENNLFNEFLSKEIEKSRYIYYSPIFDERLVLRNQNLIDISTNAVTKVKSSLSDHLLDGKYSINEYIKDNFKKQIDFVKAKTIPLPFDFPNEITVTINPYKYDGSDKQNLEEILDKNIELRKNNQYTFNINEDKEKIDKLLDYKLSDSNNNILFFIDWNELSSGEKSFLNLFSRFYSIDLKYIEYEEKTEEVKEGEKKGKELIILIDEGELGMHPQWQKQYLILLLEQLPKMFKKNNIQLILTSHSPFLVSDLPKENIIFLERGESGNCMVSDLEEREKTFGQNIHTLFADSFFMNNGTMGDFAKSKILELVDYLTDKSTNQIFTQEEARKMILMVGENLIQTKLANLYQKKFLDNAFESIEERKIRLQKELDELNNL